MAGGKGTRNTTGLVGVLLLTRSRPGPKLVFHYPPTLEDEVRKVSGLSESLEEEPDLDELNISDIDGKPTSTSDSKGLHLGVDGLAGRDPLKSAFGHLIESLEKLLSPGRWSDRKKFEVCLNDLSFVGYPVFAREDGNWSDSKHISGKKPKLQEPEVNGLVLKIPETPATPVPDMISDASHDFKHIPESLDSQAGLGLSTSMDSTSTASGMASEQLNMFHVVFVVTSYRCDVLELTTATYQQLAKVVGDALHYCQKQSNYVANESRTMLALKSKARSTELEPKELWDTISETSELAWALKEIHEKVSVGDIAGIRLNGMALSLQLCSRNQHPSNPTLDPLSALLLLDTKEAMLRELGHPDASPLSRFIRGHTPTKNLHKHATNLGIPIDDVLYLAEHLITWRKARSIMPLHQRNCYIACGQTQTPDFAKCIENYSKQFPALPSLPNILKALSTKPIQYGILIPSRDHRGPYMEILAYLVRHDLVYQLKTYGWLRVPKQPGADDEVDHSRRENMEPNLLSPFAHLTDEDDSVSVSSERTTIPLAARPSSARMSTGTRTPPVDRNPGFITIADLARPTIQQKASISAVQRSLGAEEAGNMLPDLLPFLDGEHAFEDIAAELGFKRAKVEEWLSLLEAKGYLLTARYI